MTGAWENGGLCPVFGRRAGYVRCLGGGWAMSGAWEEGGLCPVLGRWVGYGRKLMKNETGS